MNIKDMQERIQLIEKELLQLQANYNALLGAKQELTHWIKKLEDSQKQNEEDKENG